MVLSWNVMDDLVPPLYIWVRVKVIQHGADSQPGKETWTETTGEYYIFKNLDLQEADRRDIKIIVLNYKHY